MTTRRDEIDEAMLHAYVDDELDHQGRMQVDEWLAAHAGDRARVASWMAQRDGIKRLFDPVASEPIPDGIRAALTRRRGHRTIGKFAAAAAAFAIFALGTACGWLLSRPSLEINQPGLAIAERAMNSHVIYASEVRHPVEVDAGQEAHLVAWLSKRLGKPIKAPNLSRTGFSLVGGRLLPDDAVPAAQFMYENAKGQRITVYVVANAPTRESSFQLYNKGATRVFFWLDRAFTYAVAGQIAQSTLLTVARLAYEELSNPA